MDEGECEPLPANASDVEARFISKVIKRHSELIMLINTDEIFKHNHGRIEA